MDDRKVLFSRFVKMIVRVITIPRIADGVLPGWQAWYGLVDIKSLFKVYISGLSPAGVKLRCSMSPPSVKDILETESDRPLWCRGENAPPLTELIGLYFKMLRRPHSGRAKIYNGSSSKVTITNGCSGYKKRFTEHTKNLLK